MSSLTKRREEFDGFGSIFIVTDTLTRSIVQMLRSEYSSHVMNSVKCSIVGKPLSNCSYETLLSSAFTLSSMFYQVILSELMMHELGTYGA